MLAAGHGDRLTSEIRAVLPRREVRLFAEPPGCGGPDHGPAGDTELAAAVATDCLRVVTLADAVFTITVGTDGKQHGGPHLARGAPARAREDTAGAMPKFTGPFLLVRCGTPGRPRS